MNVSNGNNIVVSATSCKFIRRLSSMVGPASVWGRRDTSGEGHATRRLNPPHLLLFAPSDSLGHDKGNLFVHHQIILLLLQHRQYRYIRFDREFTC